MKTLFTSCHNLKDLDIIIIIQIFKFDLRTYILYIELQLLNLHYTHNFRYKEIIWFDIGFGWLSTTFMGFLSHYYLSLLFRDHHYPLLNLWPSSLKIRMPILILTNTIIRNCCICLIVILLFKCSVIALFSQTFSAFVV